MLDIDPNMGEWRPPVVVTNARSGEGIEELVDKMNAQTLNAALEYSTHKQYQQVVIYTPR